MRRVKLSSNSSILIIVSFASLLFVISIVGSIFFQTFSVKGQTTSGALDPTFGNRGKVTTDFFLRTDNAFAVALQSDGKIVAVGRAFRVTLDDFALARYNTNGSIDTSFGNSGKVSTDFFGNTDQANAVAIQSDGKILLAGTAVGANPADVRNDFALARYNPAGSLDNSFGISGKVVTDFSGKSDIATAIAIQKDGKIIAAGSSDGDFALVRYNEDGSLDLSFGDSGKVTTDFFSLTSDSASDAEILEDGKIIVAGSASLDDFGLARYNPDGSLDSAFGIEGKVITDLGSFRDAIADIAIQKDGKIVALGASENDMAMARYNSDGSLDTEFGNQGIIITDFAENQLIDVASGIAIRSDGKIILTGTVNNGRGIALARLNIDGSFDDTFGSEGKLISLFSISGIGDGGNAVLIQPDGNIVVAGRTFNNATGGDFAILRYKSEVTAPVIISTSISGKKFIIRGENFDIGAKILINGVQQKTKNDPQNPTTGLIGKKAGKKVKSGDRIQVFNAEGTLSADFLQS